jgi:hypothetical protein
MSAIIKLYGILIAICDLILAIVKVAFWFILFAIVWKVYHDPNCFPSH